MQCPAQGATAPPPEGWQYYDGKAWLSDPTLRVVPLAGHRWCDQLDVSGSEEAARVKGAKMGKFVRTPDFSSGHPVSAGTLLVQPLY